MKIRAEKLRSKRYNYKKQEKKEKKRPKHTANEKETDKNVGEEEKEKMEGQASVRKKITRGLD